ncbi:hypothetical protein AVEN_77326-1 [Araneus ventricosus]|uniref:Uncharacterized protein n=1 Tax=Araneus ventricosus TaxID=182803 RepID=A0A4Y2NCE6_ARAVE|nr:hypothetical protein AVEN_77326-1 [Araneus ventricosus]
MGGFTLSILPNSSDSPCMMRKPAALSFEAMFTLDARASPKASECGFRKNISRETAASLISRGKRIYFYLLFGEKNKLVAAQESHFFFRLCASRFQCLPATLLLLLAGFLQVAKRNAIRREGEFSPF